MAGASGRRSCGCDAALSEWECLQLVGLFILCFFLSRHINVRVVLQGSLWLRGGSLHIQNSSAIGDGGGFFARAKLVMQDLAQKPQMTLAFRVESSGLKVRAWARKLK